MPLRLHEQSVPIYPSGRREPPESGQIAHTGLEPEIVLGSVAVIPAPDQVRGFNIRDPVPREPWIAGRGPQ
jgi:hypothetical protein